MWSAGDDEDPFYRLVQHAKALLRHVQLCRSVHRPGPERMHELTNVLLKVVCFVQGVLLPNDPEAPARVFDLPELRDHLLNLRKEFDRQKRQRTRLKRQELTHAVTSRTTAESRSDFLTLAEWRAVAAAAARQLETQLAAGPPTSRQKAWRFQVWLLLALHTHCMPQRQQDYRHMAVNQNLVHRRRSPASEAKLWAYTANPLRDHLKSQSRVVTLWFPSRVSAWLTFHWHHARPKLVNPAQPAASPWMFLNRVGGQLCDLYKPLTRLVAKVLPGKVIGPHRWRTIVVTHLRARHSTGLMPSLTFPAGVLGTTGEEQDQPAAHPVSSAQLAAALAVSMQNTQRIVEERYTLHDPSRGVALAQAGIDACLSLNPAEASAPSAPPPQPASAEPPTPPRAHKRRRLQPTRPPVFQGS